MDEIFAVLLLFELYMIVRSLICGKSLLWLSIFALTIIIIAAAR